MLYYYQFQWTPSEQDCVLQYQHPAFVRGRKDLLHFVKHRYTKHFFLECTPAYASLFSVSDTFEFVYKIRYSIY